MIMAATGWTFGWKRKIGENVSRNASKDFLDNAKGEDDTSDLEGTIDWLSMVPKKRFLSIEDATIKSKRLKTEGSTLAESERYWEAIMKWDEALMLTPKDETIHEMKSQAYLALHELLPAVHAAENAIEHAPNWWTGYQSRGRAQLALGEVKMAINTFSKAIHLHPWDEVLWDDDLKWAISLWKQKPAVETDDSGSIPVDNETEPVKITEVKEKELQLELYKENLRTMELHNPSLCEEFCNTDGDQGVSEDTSTIIKTLPSHYVKMKY